MAPRILLVNEETSVQEVFRQIAGSNLAITPDPAAAIEIIFSETFDLVVIDSSIPGQAGLKLLETLRNYHAGPEILMLYGEDDLPLIPDALRYGVRNFLQSPPDKANAEQQINAIIEHRNLQQNLQLRGKLANKLPLVGSGSWFEELQNKLLAAAQKSEPILITGELGTEKEAAAILIQQYSGRKGQLVFKNFGEAEILNDISFLYALQGGYVVLGDCARINPETQIKLRALLSDNSLDVRIIIFSSIPLRTRVSDKKFDEGLYRLISKNEINILPLRDRVRNLPLLCQNYFEYLRSRSFTITGITSEALLELSKYRWPGNVQELYALLFLSACQKQQGELGKNDLPLNIYAPEKLENKFLNYKIARQ